MAKGDRAPGDRAPGQSEGGQRELFGPSGQLPPRARPPRPAPLAPDWRPGELDRRFAADLGLDGPALEREVRRFRARHASARGRDGKRADWPVVWRAWVQGWSAAADAAFDNWNIAADALGLPRAEVLTEARRVLLCQRLDEHGLAGWNRALAMLEDCPFLLGRNGRGFRASLDFLLDAGSLAKLIEGNYRRHEGDDRHAASRRG
jgi:hypothetical protein